MTTERLVALSYPADDDFARMNSEVLAADATIVCTYDLDDEQRAEAIRRADALVAWDVSEEIPAGVLAAAPRLAFLQLLSAGVDAIDFSALPAGLAVASNAGAYAGPMSEHVLAMTLSLAKRLPQRHAALAAGRFDKWVPSQVLNGAICVILGFGGIGIATARLLKAFGARVHAVSRSGLASEPADLVTTLADLDRVLAAADVLVISLPLTLATRGLIGARELALMKPTAILVNVARAAIVDQAALYEHLRGHPDFCAGIDTWWAEPAGDAPFRTDYPFLELPNVLGSPHNSSIVPGTMLAAARVAAENVLRFLRGERVTGLVRRADYLADHLLTSERLLHNRRIVYRPSCMAFFHSAVLASEEVDTMSDTHLHQRLEPLRRREFLRGLAATGAIAGAGGMLAGCGGSGSSAPAKTTGPGASGRPKPGGDLKLGLTGGGATDTLDPHKGLTYLDTARAQSLYQPLLQLNPAAQTEFVLAEDISPRGSTSQWVITLRKGITFHDGKPLTADDVIFTLRRILGGGNPKLALTGHTSLGPIDLKGLRALDMHTVLVPMTSPYGSFIDQLAYWYYLYIVPAGFNPKVPNGTGPFKYQSFTPGQRSVFVRNRNYWKPGLPYVDSVTIIDFSDSASLQNALTTGVIHGAGALEGPQITVLKTASGVQTVVSRTGAITPFTMRVDQAPFNDVNVRQALRLLVDRPQLINSALNGDATVGSDVFSPYDPNFDSSLHRSQDIGQAKFLLKKAGQQNLTVQLVTSAVATGTVAMATVLQQQAKAAGVTINLKTVDPATFFGPNYLHWTFSQDFYNYSPYLAQVAQSMLPTSPFNETHWGLPHYVSLYNQANATADQAVRKQIEHEMQLIDFNEGGYIIPAFIDALDAYSTKITGYSAAKVGQPLSDFDFEHFSFV